MHQQYLSCQVEELLDNTTVEELKCNLRNLKRLFLRGLNVTDYIFCDRIAIHCHNVKLEVLDLTTTNITNRTVILTALKWPHILEISLDCCTQITSYSIKILASLCHDLQRLEMAGCYLIDNDALFAVSTGCKMLKVLGVCRCNKLSDESICQIATHCSELVELNVNYCEEVTKKALISVLFNCRKLVKFYFMSTPCSYYFRPVNYFVVLLDTRYVFKRHGSDVVHRLLDPNFLLDNYYLLDDYYIVNNA
jgi:hypothetical protein